MKLLQFTEGHVPGKENIDADELSCAAPIAMPTAEYERIRGWYQTSKPTEPILIQTRKCCTY